MRYLLGTRRSRDGQIAFTNWLNWSRGCTLVSFLLKKVLVISFTHQSFFVLARSPPSVLPLVVALLVFMVAAWTAVAVSVRASEFD